VIRRRQQAQVADRLRTASSVVLLGPRQVGKTTLARRIAAERGARAVYLDLERPADRRRLDDADAFLRAQRGKLVVIDEIHLAPGLFSTLRGVIDDRRASRDRTGQFLLLGSAALDLMRQSTQSLAGRVAYVELAPIDAGEWPSRGRTVDQLWVRGGFPLSVLAKTDTLSLAWRRDFIRSYLERDVPMFAPRLPAETIARLWGMLAHGQGTLLNQSRLASSLGVSAPAVARYVDLLVDLLLVRRLRPWSGNLGKRLVRAPKTYVRDSGLLHALLELETWHDVVGHPVTGPSWEGFVIENVIAAAGDRQVPYFFRTEDGAEIDLVFERGGRVEFAIEIKRTTAPDLSKGFRLGCAALRPRESYVVHAGSDQWTMGHGVTAISLAGLMTRMQRAR
jgi:hypothetical protein